MQKIIFGIFAHPDDEAFGPCGTLILESQGGAELHLITLTDGNGQKSANPDNVPDLGDVRLEEWKSCAKQLGAHSTHHLGYRDGKLNNDDQPEICRQIEQIVATTIENRASESYEIEFMSFDLNGVTGHIDHIVTSRSVCQSFYSLKARGIPVSRIRLFCLTRTQFPRHDTSFVFMEAGRNDDEIDETIDASSVIDTIYTAMNCHKSQRADQMTLIDKLGDAIAINHFIIKQ